MDFSALSSELQNIAGRYNGRDTDPAYSTTMYCEMFHKILQKTETEVHDYADQIVILWMTLSQLCNTANTLAACPARNELYQDIFLQCAKTVLNIKWQNLPEEDQSKENFTETVKATHVQLVTTGFDRFSLLLHLMENPWTDPTLSEIMSGEADNDDDAVQEYIRNESTLILKLRVEMLMQENCEEFALNLSNTLMGHEVFVKDMDLRETQLKLLYKLNQMDKLQEVCEKIVCHDGVKLVLRLEQKESNQALSVRLIQLFLVQDWIKPEQKCCTQELLKLWIRHQYIADHNKEKFLDSVWAIAKLSLCTQQILLLVSGLHRECGNEMIQLYTDLCVYAINVDKGCCEQQMLQGNMEGVKDRQHAIAQTCRKLSALYNGLNPKISRISSLTAFSLDASLVNLCLVERMFNRKYCTHSKKECAACIKVFSSVTHCVGDVKVNPATLYEVERLLNMLRPYYLNPDLAWKELLPVCQKFMKERSQSSSLETKEETTPPKTPPKKKSDSKPKTKKSSTKKEMSVSPGNIKYYCDDNVSYLPKESVPKMKNKNFRMKLAAPSSNSCTQTPKPDDSKAKPQAVKPATTPPKASTVFEFDKQLFQYNFKGKQADSGSSASSTVVKEQMSPAGSELSNSFANNHPKTPTQIANLKCQAVGVDSLGQPVLVKLPISVGSQSTATIPSTVSGVVAPSAARQRTMYIGDPTSLCLQSPNPNTGLHIAGQGKIQKPKKRQPHSIGELLEATRTMPCSTSSNFNTTASNVTSPKPATQHSLPTSADLLRAARDYNLTIVQKPVTPKPFQTQYSTADLLRATKNIPQKSKPELQSASNLQSAKDMMQATKAAFAASVLGFIPKPQATILSEVSQGIGLTSLHNQGSVGSVGTSGSELKPTKKPKALRKPKTVVPGQVNQKAKIKQLNVSQCNSVQSTSNKTLVAHSYKTVDGSISFLSSNVAGASNTIPTLVNQINAQSQSPVRPPANSYQVIANDKSNHRPRIIPIRATCNSKFPPYSSAITSDALSLGQVVGANTTVTTSAGSITSTQTHKEHDIYNLLTKEKTVVKQSPTTAKIGGFRRPSADELQSIVDWLQTGTEDDKKKMQVQSPVSAHITVSTQEVVTTVPSSVQSGTPPSVGTPTVTSASSFVTSPAAVAPKAVSLTQEQLQKIMAGLSQRQKIKQKSPSPNKAQQKKSLNKQLQQLLAQDIKKGSQLVGNRNNFVQQNPLQKSHGNNDKIIQSSSSHGNQLVQPSSIHGNQLVQPSSTPGNQLVQPSSSHGNQLVQPSMPTTPGIQTVQPLTSSTPGSHLIQSSLTHGNQLVQSLTTPGIQLFQSSTHGSKLVQPSMTQGHQLAQPTAFENQLVQSSITPGIQLVQSSTALGIQILQPSLTDGSQLMQPTTSLGNQLVHSTFTPGIQPVQPSTANGILVQPTSSYGNQLSFSENLLVQSSAPQRYQAIQPAPTHENQSFQPIPSLGNQLSLVQENQVIQFSPTQGKQAAQPVLTTENQPIQQSQNQGVVSGNPLFQSTIQGIYAGNQQIQPSQFQEVSASIKPQLIAPALTLPVSSQVTVSQSLSSTDQVTNAIQTISTTGIQPSLSFPSQFQISGSKSLTMSPSQSNTRVLELQYLGQINPPSKILHPKPPSEDSSLVLSTTASGDPVSQPGKTSELLPEMNIKAACEIQGLMKSKQPTFIPKTISSDDELNIPKMPLGTLKVVEKPDLVSTFFGKNRNPSKLNIDNNHSVAVGGSIEKVSASMEKQQHRAGEREPAVSSSSDHDASVNNTQSNTSSTQTLPLYGNTSCSMPTTTQVPYPQNDRKAQKNTCTLQDQFESTNYEITRVGGNARDVPHALDTQTPCSNTTSELSISSSSETDKEVKGTDAVDTSVPVNNREKVLETKLENIEISSEKESDVSLGIVDGTTCPDSTTRTTNSDGDADNNSTVVNNQQSCDDNDVSVHSLANNTDEKNDVKSKRGQVLDPFPFSNVTDMEQAIPGDMMLPTPKGDNLAGKSLPMKKEMKETTAMEPTERLPEVREPEAPCSSSYDSDPTGMKGDPVKTICTASNLFSSGMEENPVFIRKENLVEDKSLPDFQKVTGLDSDTSKLSQSLVKEISEETENATNVMESSSDITKTSTEHVEKAPIPESSNTTSAEEMTPNVPVHTTVNVVTPISTDKDSERNEVSNDEESSVKADNEVTIKSEEDMGGLVLTLDDALGESTALLSTPIVPCVSTEPTQQMAEDNLTPELRNLVLPNEVKVKSIGRSDANDEKANPVIKTVPTQDFRFEFELDNIKNGEVTEKRSVESPPPSQDTLETGKPPEQEKEAPSDPMKVKEGVDDMETGNKQSLIITNQDPLEKDSIPTKGWENAFVSFIDNLGEKKMVKTDNSKVHIRPIFSRQDSSGSESSSRSVGSSLGSRGSHRSSLDEESSGTRILPLQRRENDVKRYEYFSYHSSSHKSNRKRLSNKGLSGLQIQALPEIKAKSKQAMKLVPAAEATEVPQQKEVVNKCIICSKVFRSVESLKCHVRNICRPVDSRPDSNLKDFEYSTTYSCHKCEKEVSKKEEIKAHVAECFKDDDVIQSLSFSTKYMCQMCGEYFTSKDDVHSHVSRLCSKVMSCRQQQQDRLDRKTELTAKPLADMVESWYSKDEKHTDDNIKEEVLEEAHEEGEEKKTLGLDDLESEIFNESNNQSNVDTKEESKSKPVLSKKRKHQVSNISLPSKQWSLRNKTKFSSRLKGFEFFTNKLNPARRRTEQRKWHEDYHSLRNRVVKKEAVKQVIEGKEEVQSLELDGKTYAKHKKIPRVAARSESIPKREPSEDNKDNEIKCGEETDSNMVVSSMSIAVKLEKKESDNTEMQNHTSAKSKGAPKDATDVNTMNPPLRQKRVIQVGRKFLQDEFEVPEFLKIQVANTNLKRKSPQHCPKCGQVFSSSYILIQHVVRVHMSPCKSKWNSSARKLQYPCWYCSDAFPTYAKFAKHVPVHKDKILAMLKKNCSTNRRLRRGTVNINNVTTKANETGISKTKNSIKSEPVSSTHNAIVHRDPSPTKETEAQALSQHVESMRTSRRARGQPPLALDVSDLKVETVKKERSLSREKDLTPVSGLVSSGASVSLGTLDMRTTRSKRRDNDSMSTSSFDHDDDLASNCSHATDKSSQSRGRRDYNKRGPSEDRESMTSDDSVCHRPVTRHQGAAHISPLLQDSHGTAKKPKLASGHHVESEQGRRSRTRSGNVLPKTTSIKCNDVEDKGMSDKHQAETKSTNKVGPSKGLGSLSTRNQSKVRSDKKTHLSDCVSQLRHVRKEARTDQNVQEKEIFAKGPDETAEDDSNPASNMTTRRSRRLNNSLADEKEGNTKKENSSKRSVVDQAPVTRHKIDDNKGSNSMVNKSVTSKGKINTKSKLAEKVAEPRKRKFPAKERVDDSSIKCVKNEIEVNKNQSVHVNTVDQKSVLIVSEEDEEFVYVKSPLSSPSMSPRGITPVVKIEKAAPNAKPVDGKVDKSAFIESFKKYIHKPAPRWTPPFPLTKKSNVTKSKLRQKVCRAQARLLQKRRRTKMESAEFSSEDEADDELDEDIQDSQVSKKNDEKKSFLDSFIAHCDNGPRLKGFYPKNSPFIVPKENSTEDSSPETLPKEKKPVGGKRKPQGQASQGHQVKKEVITESQRTIANTESKVPVTVKLDARQSKSECVKGKADQQPAESKDKELDMDCSEEVKSITESKDCRPCASVEQGSKLDPATARPTSFESLQTYIDSMSNSASPTPSVDSTTSKDTHSKRALKISKSMASTFQDSFMTYLGSKPKKSRKTSDGSCSSSECGDVKSCSSSVCDGDTGAGQKSQGQKSHPSKPFTWDMDSGDERIDLLVSTLGRVVTETSETGSKPDVTRGAACSEEAQSETSVSARSSVERILPNKHSHLKTKVRRIYHDGKIWEIGHGSVKSVSVVQPDIVTTDKVHGRDSPVSDISDCGESDYSINNKSDPVNISRPEQLKGDNRISSLKSEHHHLSKSSKTEQNVQASVEMIRVDRKHDGGGFVRLDKSEIDQYDKMNTYTSVTPEDMALKKTENVKKTPKWKVKTEKRTKSSNMKEFPFVFKKNRRM
ncbi:uncharacterized protein LOC110442129 isoform X2 [Mizuhopecten yessoensis]|uniref:uncharacterized protein LOC110442129 isoform X2 n=1 Tax=Mizuhopecten yessoensis TaxID=6573 RepID=UPI000B459AE2|nr:uncharacterized protein LOC110442129 isoform X2 [Mizuhopecten yessoensis]